MKRIAVTGASGFVGRALVSRLRGAGFEVVAISRGRSQDVQANDGFRCCPDYLNTEFLAGLFVGCHAVIHLAARAHRILDDPDSQSLDSYRVANIDTIVSVAQAARHVGVQRVVFVSSIGVNGSSTFGVPFTEASPPSPSEPYAISKLEAENALACELAHSSTDWVVLRPPLVYGPGCPGNLQRLIRLASSAPFLPFGSLHARRTLISIDNLTSALLVSALHQAVSKRVFIVSDSQDIDIAGILAAFLKGLGRRGWRLIPFPPSLIGFVMRLLRKNVLWQKFSGELIVDCSTFCRVTGWVPAGSPSDGLRSAASYSQQRLLPGPR
jgi:nucleoside-diphosphate-sugar epimerase